METNKMKMIRLQLMDEKRFRDALTNSNYCPGIFFLNLPKSDKGILTRNCAENLSCDKCWEECLDLLLGAY